MRVVLCVFVLLLAFAAGVIAEERADKAAVDTGEYAHHNPYPSFLEPYTRTPTGRYYAVDLASNHPNCRLFLVRRSIIGDEPYTMHCWGYVDTDWEKRLPELMAAGKLVYRKELSDSLVAMRYVLPDKSIRLDDTNELNILKDGNDIVWYSLGGRFLTARVVDGKYMIVTAWYVYYVFKVGDKLVAETYDTAQFIEEWRMNKENTPDRCDILGKDVYRYTFDSGRVEIYKIDSEDKCLIPHYSFQTVLPFIIWSNGKHPRPIYGRPDRLKHCNYWEGGAEPDYDTIIERSKAPAVKKEARSHSPEKEPAGSKGFKEKKNLFVCLIVKIKRVFAGLFA
ncbi:MAG: hypothetical protein IK083_07035 [Abditibacteriota bacterium]|nr:hypothetical protein [Abditibacteriota bacterium]